MLLFWRVQLFYIQTEEKSKVASAKVRRVTVSEQTFNNIETICKGSERTKTAVVGRLINKEAEKQASKIREKTKAKSN